MRANGSTPRRGLRSITGLRVGFATLLASSALVSAMVISASRAAAVTVTVTVTNCDSTGPGSLADVVAGAPAGSMVTFSVTCPSTSPISLTSTIDVQVPITIEGPGASAMVVDGSSAVGTVFQFEPNVSGASISGLSIQHGGNADGSLPAISVPSTDSGITLSDLKIKKASQGISNEGTLTLSDCTMTGDNAFGPSGGAIYNDGDLTITSSTFKENTISSGNGGAIDSGGGSVTITGSTISDNLVGQGTGGGIENDAGTMTIADTTISGNYAQAVFPGGGIYNAGTMSVTDSTVSSNIAVGGGGIDNTGSLSVIDSTISNNDGEAPDYASGAGGNAGILNSGALDVTASTLAHNVHGTGIESTGGTASLAATVLANMYPFYDCSGVTIDAGYNLDDDGTCDFSATNDSFSHVEPYLGPLQNNGGPTQTNEPALGSPLLNDIPMGSTANGITLCPSTDQRGVARPQGSECDIGAVELSPTSQDITSPNEATATAGEPFSFTITTTGTPTPKISETGALAPNLTFANNHDGTATISGKAKKVGSSKLLIEARFGKGSTAYVVLQKFKLTITGPSISNVEISNNVTAPTVTINGTGFGTVADLGAGRGACGSSPTGYDYGNHFLFADTTDGWNAGEATPDYDCIGVTIQSYSSEQIVFTFGSEYGVYPIGSGVALLNSGDQFTMTLLGASFSGTAEYTTGTAPSTNTTTPASSSIVIGNANSDSAVVSGNATYGSPTGTVTFYECGPSASPEPCTSLANQVGSPVGVTAGANDTSSASSVSFTPSSSGYWCFAGYYSGDANYAGSSDTTTDECFEVMAHSSTTTTPASKNIDLGSASSDSAVVNGGATYGSPTGTVTFYECGPTATPEPCTSEANQLGSPVPVTAGASDTSSASSVSFTPSSAGYWCFAGYYSGDVNYAASSDTSTDECFDVAAPLDDAVSVVGSSQGYCALLTSSGVDCWGLGTSGQLGDGSFSEVDTPVAVEGVGGTGTLTGVTNLVSSSAGAGAGYCALLTSGAVDCWGYGYGGQLGNGTFEGSATPVEVEGVGGTGTLTGVTTLVAGQDNYCAVLTSGGVDCWGYGYYGELGNGTFYTTGDEGSATPVEVEGVGGTGTLTGVTNLVGSDFDRFAGYCALLTSGGVDCWGYGYYGELGNGTFYTTGDGSATPVAVDGVGGIGTLTGVTNLATDGEGGYCALLASGEVDCWGLGDYGQLGDGEFYTGPVGSATPVAVEGVGGTGTLTGVTSLVSSGSGGGGSYCAVLSSGGVACWGQGVSGQLGNGTFYSNSPFGSATPVAVEGVGGIGTLTGVTSLVSEAGNNSTYCAFVASGGVDCWGSGYSGELGNGAFYTTGDEGSATPVEVEGVGGTGTLSGATSLAGDLTANQDGETFCALLTSDGVDCWGSGNTGQLGDGEFYTSGPVGSATPVAVEAG